MPRLKGIASGESNNEFLVYYYRRFEVHYIICNSRRTATYLEMRSWCSLFLTSNPRNPFIVKYNIKYAIRMARSHSMNATISTTGNHLIKACLLLLLGIHGVYADKSINRLTESETRSGWELLSVSYTHLTLPTNREV